MGCSVSVLDDGSQDLVLSSRQSGFNQSVPVGVLAHAGLHKSFRKQRPKRKSIKIDSNIVQKNTELTLQMTRRNQKGYDLYTEPLTANNSIFQTNKRSGIKNRIKNQFFKGIGNLSLCSVLKDEFQEDCSSIPEFTSTKQHGQTSTNLQRALQSDANSPMEKEASISSNSCLEDRMLGSLKNLSLLRSNLSLRSNESAANTARSSLTSCSHCSEAFSIVYISDINSNLNSSSNDPEACSSAVIIKEIPTIQLMQSGHKGIGHYDSLTLESEEVAVAVHQDFFNGFGDDFDDDLLFSSTSED